MKQITHKNILLLVVLLVGSSGLIYVFRGRLAQLATRARREMHTIPPAKETTSDPQPDMSHAAPAAVPGSGMRLSKEALPLAFVKNEGQFDERVAFHLQGRDTALYFTSKGLTLSFTGASNTVAQPQNASLLTKIGQNRIRQRYNLKLDFIGANPAVKPTGQTASPTQIGFFSGPPKYWRTGIPTYSSVVYKNLWPGIDLVWGGTTSRLKYKFIVHPGANPNQIRLAYRGTTNPLKVNPQGQLEISSPMVVIRDEKPISYQKNRSIKTEFTLARHTKDSQQEYGFKVGKYDRNHTLVIDPAVLVYSGLIGGSGDEEGHSIAVDKDGNAYVTGITTSLAATFPDAVGPDLTYNGRTDAFVAKIKADGSGLAYCGYLGGDGDDEGHGIAVDASGNAYVTGLTTSFETSFPVVGGPALRFNGGMDVFVAKVNPTGTALVYCGYIGGSDDDEGLGIAVDSSGRAYVTGLTASDETSFPKLIGPKLTFGGTIDAFVARIKTDGSGLDYAGYLGGSGDDQGRGIAVDASGNAYVTGLTTSTEPTFTPSGGFGSTFKGGTDAFVAKINPDGTGLLYSGFIGGSGIDEAFGIALDSAYNAYIAGRTTSSEATFPKTVGTSLTFKGATDAFVAKINASGSALSYAGYIGGSGEDEAFGIAVDDAGQAYVTGRTTSSAASFPVSNTPYQTLKGTSDAFIAKVNTAGNGLVYAGYFGGNGLEEGFGTAVNYLRQAYFTGRTNSSDGSFPALVGPSLTFGGASDAFVAKFRDSSEVLPTNAALLVSNPTPTYGQAVTLTVTVTRSGYPVTTGTVSFKENSTVLAGPLILNANGQVSFMTSTLSAVAHTITAEYSGATGFASSSNAQSFSVSKAVLTVRADNKSRVYGAANPLLTATISGFVNNENSSVVNGAPSLNTTATVASPPADYLIQAANGTLATTNYSFTFVNGTLTITKASVTVALNSSANPSLAGQPITLTAMLSPVTATGKVEFFNGNLSLGQVSVAGGQAAINTGALAYGSYSFRAVYLGDTNYASSQSTTLLQSVGNTGTGSNVTITSNGVTVRFSSVTKIGSTIITAIPATSAGVLPPGFSLGGLNIAFDVTTDAIFTGPITITFPVNATLNQEQFATLRVLHGENGQLIDRTILAPDSPFPNFTQKEISARVSSLSPFVIAVGGGGVSPAVSSAKAGSVLVFPYFTSKLANKYDTRLTISNVSNATTTAANMTYVHIFLIDGTSCQQADLFLCLTPNASFSFKASEYDPDTTGWLLAVAVDVNGKPIQNNVLIGNAFVRDGDYMDNYGAEAFWANSVQPATLNADTATLKFNSTDYDLVPAQLSCEIQSPLDATNQRIITVGLSGDLSESKLDGAGQVGSGLAYNGNEKLVGSFSNFLLGSCQARATISISSPRVPNGMNTGIPSGQVGTLRIPVGAAVGLLMTPHTAKWNGIRGLHKTGLTSSTLTIPIVRPVC